MKHLVTPRLLMRPFSESDFGDLYSLYSDPEVMKYITGGIPRTADETRKSLERMMRNFEESGYGMFALFERKEKRFIGRCGLQPLEDNGQIELGYTLIPTAWGKGYATESAMEVLRTAFGEWGLEKIIAIAGEENRASTRVMEKIGMLYCGHERFYNKDVILYAIESPKRPEDAFFRNNMHHISKLNTQLL